MLITNRKTVKRLPKKRRQYHSIVSLIGGLNYAVPSTMIDDRETPKCEEIYFRRHELGKAYGANYFISTPLLTQLMLIKTFIKNNETQKLMAHTMENIYDYNTTSELFECITEGVVVEDCEAVWTVPANVTVATDTDARKGNKSVKLTVDAAFTTGVFGYKNFASTDLSSYDHLHFYLKSSVDTTAGQLRIRLSEQNGGGTGATYADYNVPALTAGEWQEVSVSIDSPDADSGDNYPTDLDAVLSVSLVLTADLGAMTVNVDDVMATIEQTGDEDNQFCATVVNDQYVFSNGIAPLKYWDMSAATVAEVAGTTSKAAYSMLVYGERLNLYRLPDLPRRVAWTVVGGLSTPPAATDWTDAGSGDTDLDGVFGEDVIMTAHRIGNFVAIYGKDTIVLQEYTGASPSSPYSFYTRVSGKGTPSPRGVASLGNSHIMMGWDDIYLYRGGTEVLSIGDKVSDEIFTIINPQYIERSFFVYLNEQHEVRLYFPLIGSSTPNCYFTYSLRNKSWSRGSRSYTAMGTYNKKSSETWESFGSGTATWASAVGRWNDVILEATASTNLYGDSSGYIYEDIEDTYNLAGSAIDAYWETKDFVVDERYRDSVTNWMELIFEARGNSLTVEYSTDLGETWSAEKSFTLESAWKRYKYDIGVNSPQIRFRFRNSSVDETFELRQLEIGYIKGSDRGVD